MILPITIAFIEEELRQKLSAIISELAECEKELALDWIRQYAKALYKYHAANTPEKVQEAQDYIDILNSTFNHITNAALKVVSRELTKFDLKDIL